MNSWLIVHTSVLLCTGHWLPSLLYYISNIKAMTMKSCIIKTVMQRKKKKNHSYKLFVWVTGLCVWGGGEGLSSGSAKKIYKLLSYQWFSFSEQCFNKWKLLYKCNYFLHFNKPLNFLFSFNEWSQCLLFLDCCSWGVYHVV